MSLSAAVILTARDEQEHLPACLEGIAAQDRLPDECILLDDGSVDETPLLLRAFAHQFGVGAKLVRTGGIGRAGALTAAMAESTADVLVIQDADDVSRPLRVRVHTDAFFEDESLDWHFGQILYVDEYGKGGLRSRYPTNGPGIQQALARNKMPVPHAASAFRGQLARQGQWYGDDLGRAQDFELLLRRGPGMCISGTSEVLVDYRSEASDLTWAAWRKYRREHYYAIYRAYTLENALPFDEWLAATGWLKDRIQSDAHEYVRGLVMRLARVRVRGFNGR